MSILATITKEDGTEIQTICGSWSECAAWVESIGDYVQAQAKEIIQENKE